MAAEEGVATLLGLGAVVIIVLIQVLRELPKILFICLVATPLGFGAYKLVKFFYRKRVAKVL